MMVITGGVGQGKLAYVLERTGLGEGDVAYTAAQAWDRPIFAGVTGWIREALARGEDPDAALDALLDGRPELVLIFDEVGCGVVPTDPAQRQARERAGRLSCLLAREADVVIRVCCGLPQVLKGEWTC